MEQKSHGTHLPMSLLLVCLVRWASPDGAGREQPHGHAREGFTARNKTKTTVAVMGAVIFTMLGGHQAPPALLEKLASVGQVMLGETHMENGTSWARRYGNVQPLRGEEDGSVVLTIPCH